MEKFITITRKRKEETSANTEGGIERDAAAEEYVERSKTKRRSFNAHWGDDEEFKKWLITGAHGLPRCKVCGVDLKASGGKKDLTAHAKTTKHIENSNAVNIHKGSKEIIEGIPRATFFAEIKVAAFCAEHNIAFTSMDHLSPLINNTFLESKAAQNFACRRTKTTALIKNMSLRTYRPQNYCA
ncbi:uncharacterized protein LOC118736207 [Rhagoletis pomonella]|uniref:uncharacterized protein LOC118736207 n=1 Tax=Rhagoletis pomonella TaxID=28610 RepID=UPI00178442AB|nr:uncharacterized protein LOC118736207 [Rhagoletis pomonella]